MQLASRLRNPHVVASRRAMLQLNINASRFYPHHLVRKLMQKLAGGKVCMGQAYATLLHGCCFASPGAAPVVEVYCGG